MGDNTINRTRDMAVDMEKHRQELEHDTQEHDERMQRMVKMIREDELRREQKQQQSIHQRLDLGR